MPRGVVCSGGHERDNDAVTTRSVRGSQNVLDDGHRSRGRTLAHYDRERDDDDDDDGRSGGDGAADSPYSATWREMLALLVHYTAREGHCRVPFLHKEESLNLGTWVWTQRIANKKRLSLPGQNTTLGDSCDGVDCDRSTVGGDVCPAGTI